MRFAIFRLQSIAPATKNWCQVIRSAAPVTQNHLRKSTYLMLQNATPLRKSAPWPPNISDEHVFCTAPATRNASLQILFKSPMNCGRSYHQCARCFNKDLTSISRRAQLPTPQELKKTCCVLSCLWVLWPTLFFNWGSWSSVEFACKRFYSRAWHTFRRDATFRTFWEGMSRLLNAL